METPPCSPSNRRFLRCLSSLVLGATAWLAVPPLACAFEKSKTVEYENFREPPREYRQQAWLGFNLRGPTSRT